MRILGIETSCDETGAAIVEDGTKLISNALASSIKLHAKTGGIIPETAAREQIKYIIPVINRVIKQANIDTSKLDAIAVTVGPGLLGSLLVGVETAKTLSYVWDKPIIPVNHLIGHIYANFIEQTDYRLRTTAVDGRPSTVDITFPALGLIVSGGHTDLVLLKNHGRIKWLGGTRDDAAGEAFDKIARLLGLPYPGGPAIEKAAQRGNISRFKFPRPMIDLDDFDFSFSGLKTAVLREVKTIEQPALSRAEGLNNRAINDIAASVQQVVIDVLVAKTIKAAKQFEAKSILLGGGVAANQTLRDRFKLAIGNLKLEIPFFFPEKWLCTDNAAMIASAAFFNYKPLEWKKITANPQLYFD
ncbi:MAG: tRNA (adenosine(37)-N6)-threonylcarbamoyltransferase complex transferase subunit TsaD [Candidatus Levybacteria bacterium]|nr:tRNA (adenosine(37)-N6)-threonylcarbamoyltransferase complex transferase subunit TsaD [Candidatus Levybacteria bacterium]